MNDDWSWTKIELSKPSEPPPTEPVVKCLGCGADFVWWLHPIQLCDACVDKEYAKAESEMLAAYGAPVPGCPACSQIGFLCDGHPDASGCV